MARCILPIPISYNRSNFIQGEYSVQYQKITVKKEEDISKLRRFSIHENTEGRYYVVDIEALHAGLRDLEAP